MVYLFNVKRNSITLGGILLLGFAAVIFASAVDTFQGSMSVLEKDKNVMWGDTGSIKRFNPMVSGIASLTLPGAGQLYTGHYIKALFYPALEATFISMSWFWHENASFYNKNARVYRAWEEYDTTLSDKMDHRELVLINRHKAIESRFSEYNFLTWAIGAHLFNTLDALQSSRFFDNSRERKPKTAALLAAIPGLGMGQLYNGSLSKAGMVMMGQVSLGLMAYNSHRLMKMATMNYARLTDPNADSLTMVLKNTYADDWYGSLNRAFTNRNMYLWYSIFFYLYSIFDATVDAYLHDYPEKMKIVPDLVIGPKSISISFSTALQLPITVP